jgi:TolA-binding protein
MKHLLFVLTIIFQVLLFTHGTAASAGQAAKMSDQEIVEFTRNLLEKPRITKEEQEAGLRVIKSHNFKDKNAPEKEYLTYAQGILEDRVGLLTNSVVTFRRFERTWPKSQYMPEAHFVLGVQALNQNKYKDAESRFRLVVDSDLPIESKYNAQGLLAWCMLEQNRMGEAVSLTQHTFPIGKSKPDERALVAIMLAQCEAKAVDAAKKTRTSYRTAYPQGPMKVRVDIAWGLLCGQTGQNVEASRALRDVIREYPNSEQADEARLALATLLADGKLTDRANPNNDTPDALIAQLRSDGTSGDAIQRGLQLQIRLAVQNKQRDKILSLTERYAKELPDASDAAAMSALRADTINSIVQDAVEGTGLMAALPLLNVEYINAITPKLRSGLVSECVKKGLPEAATRIIQASPESERAALRALLTENISDPLPPPKVLAGLNGDLKGYKGELGQIHILLSEKKWNEASIRIENISPGTDRIKAVLALLLRPMPANEIQFRRKEAEGWLAKCSEKNPLKDPLLIFIADLYMQTGNPKEALEFYPSMPLPEHSGWVSFMRASAMDKLGQKDAAKRVLAENDTVPEFLQYRRALARQLNRTQQ